MPISVTYKNFIKNDIPIIQAKIDKTNKECRNL